MPLRRPPSTSAARPVGLRIAGQPRGPVIEYARAGSLGMRRSLRCQEPISKAAVLQRIGPAPGTPYQRLFPESIEPRLD